MTNHIRKIKSTGLTLSLLVLATNMIGCTSSHLNTFGPEPLIERESFEKINLLLLLDSENDGAESVDTGYTQKKKVQMAFDKFYKNPVDQLRRRNSVQERILAASQQRCGEYKKFLKQFESDTNFGLGSATTLFAGAGSIFTPLNTVRALSGSAAIISGVRSEFNEDYFASQTVQMLTSGFEAKRTDLYQAILKRRVQSMTDYPVEAAIKDSIEYHASCSLVTGLEYAALSIDRVNNPGLKGAQKALVEAKKLQHIMALEPEEVSSLSFSDIYNPTNLNAHLIADKQSENEQPLAVFSNIRSEIARFDTRFNKLSNKLKAGDFAKKYTNIDEIGKLVTQLVEQTWALLAEDFEATVVEKTLNIQKAKAKVTETLDPGQRRLLEVALAQTVLDSGSVLDDIRKIYIEVHSGYLAAVSALKDKKEPKVTERMKNTSQTLNQTLSVMLQKRAKVLLTSFATATIAQSDITTLKAALNAINGVSGADDHPKMITLLKAFDTDFKGFSAKDVTAQKTVIDKATQIMDVFKATIKTV